MTKWINVEEQLPPPNDEDPGHSHFVLFTNGREIGLGTYEYEYFGEDHNDPSHPYCSPSWYDATDHITDEVTHWMSLPGLPKEMEK